MAIDALVAPLLRVELFQGLKPIQFTEIARRADRVVFHAGDRLSEAGKDADAAILIVSGSAEWLPADADDGAEVLTEPVAIGSLIGEMGMLIDHVYGATIVAVDQVRCLKLSRATMHEMMLEDPSLAEHLTDKITARLGRLADTLRAIDDDFASQLPAFALEPTPSPTTLTAAVH